MDDTDGALTALLILIARDEAQRAAWEAFFAGVPMSWVQP